MPNLMPYLRRRRRYTAVLPPAGPAWAGSLMGCSITSSLLHIHGFHTAALIMIAIAGISAVLIAGGFLIFRSPPFEATVMPAWAMVSMGILALGSATSTVLGDSWWGFHIACAVLGGILGVVTYAMYFPLILRHKAGSPTFSWGLPMVTTMVASTVGMQARSWLIAEGASSTLSTFLLWLSFGAFLLSIAVAPLIFARVYYFYFSPAARRSGHHLESMAAPTAWIPLGVVGQSTVASQLLGAGFGSEIALNMALGYGWIMFCLAIPIGAFAHVLHYEALFQGVTYSPTWWASTFPVGTFCLGTHSFYLVTGHVWLNWISLFLLVVLLVHVGVSTLGGTIAIIRKIVGSFTH